MDDEMMTRDTTRLKTQSVAYLQCEPVPLHHGAPCHGRDGRRNPGDRAVHGRENHRSWLTAFSASKFVPMPAPAALGAIMRNGTTVHIPYITQFANYNQRIVIVNRGAEAAYSMSFMSEDRVMVTPGAECRGDVGSYVRPPTWAFCTVMW